LARADPENLARRIPDELQTGVTMLRFALAYVATALVFTAIDALWLSAMGGWYKRMAAGLMREGFSLGPAVAFYLLYVLAMTLFAVLPALGEGKPQTALLQGALFGFFAYATYDLTNQATLKGWPLGLTLVDLAWGTAVTGASSFLGALAAAALLAKLAR
jgi:uncharacterized membrane protein